MLACEQNLQFHMDNFDLGYDASSVSNVPETLASFSRDFNQRFEDSNFFRDVFAGESIPDAFGQVRDFNAIGGINYFKMRKMSRQLVTENMYAAAIQGRLGTNVINEGLKLESNPSTLFTKFDDDQHVKWTTKTQELWKLWSSDQSVDVESVHDLSALEKILFDETFVEGDTLVVIKIDPKTFLPKVKLIPGRNVREGINSQKIKDKRNRIIDGVEVDKAGRHIAYHVVEGTKFGGGFEAKRILARGRTSDRTTAYLHYYQPPPPGRTRGFPVLMRIIQPLAQIGRYSTFELKAAEINAALAIWIKKTENVAASNALGGPTLKTNADNEPTQEVREDIGRQRMQGGQIINEVAHGEEIESFDSKRPSVNFAGFRKAILQDIAMSLGIPPEVLFLMFENSFSASRQATVEMKALVMKDRSYFYKQFDKPIYGQWLLGMVLTRKIEAKGYVEAFKGDDLFVKKGWQQCRFTGFIKQNVDILKEAKAYKEYIDEGLMDRDQASLELTGADYETTAKRLLKQNKALAEAREPLLGEINTSISRVGGEKSGAAPKPPTEPKAPTPPKRPKAAASKLVGEAVFSALVELMESGGDIDDIESVNSDIDSMDIEELQEV